MVSKLFSAKLLTDPMFVIVIAFEYADTKMEAILSHPQIWVIMVRMPRTHFPKPDA